MRRTLVPLALLALGAALVTMSPATAHACKCMFPTVAQGRDQASAVFEGRVTKIEDVASEVEGGIGLKKVTLILVRTWKGLEQEESVVVKTSASSASCGYGFALDQSYLVYAGGTPPELEVSSCSRTKPMDGASEDLAVLGAGITPVTIAPVEPKEATPPQATPKSGGCGSVSGTAQASATFALLPITGIAFATRRRLKRS
jgi:hypothetical protein